MITGHVINCLLWKSFDHFGPPSKYYPTRTRTMLNFRERILQIISTVLKRHENMFTTIWGIPYISLFDGRMRENKWILNLLIVSLFRSSSPILFSDFTQFGETTIHVFAYTTFYFVKNIGTPATTNKYSLTRNMFI